jgi:succinate dehydrogenase / fumarate reductase cytochrome b subunit
MSALWQFWDSSLGKKVVMAVTGLIGVGFVLGHMVGNLQVFGHEPGEAMHKYALLLRTSMPLLYAIRLTLVGAVALHITAAYQLTMRNRAARPQDYAKRSPQVSTIASQTLRWGGVLLLAFIVFHIADMTLGIGHPQFTHLDPYNNLVYGMRRPLVALFYVAAVAALGLHLWHGAWASFRTLGLRKASDTPFKRNLAIAVAVLVVLGFAAVPIAAGLGMLKPDVPLDQQAAVITGTPRTAPNAQ